jgi:hypothetical protein
MADDASRESPDGSPDQRARAGVMARRVANDRTRAGTNGTAGQRARGRIVWPPFGCVTPRQNNPGSQDCNNQRICFHFLPPNNHSDETPVCSVTPAIYDN